LIISLKKRAKIYNILKREVKSGKNELFLIKNIIKKLFIKYAVRRLNDIKIYYNLNTAVAPGLKYIKKVINIKKKFIRLTF